MRINENYRIYNGDCLEIMDRLIEEGIKVDAIITDPPFGTTQNKWDSVIPFDEMWKRIKKLRGKNAPTILFSQSPFDKVLGSSNITELKTEWIWVKNRGTGHLNAKKQPMKAHENILVFYSKPPTYNPQMREGEPYVRKECGKNSLNKGNYGKTNESNTTINKGGRYPLDVIYFPVVERTVHPTQKPVELMEYLIKTYTNEGGMVLDFTSGSFTTGVACINTGRRFIGIELDKGYFEIGEKRMQDATADKNKEVEDEL